MTDDLTLAEFLAHPDLPHILTAIADVIEYRGARRLDLDPAESADWLRQQAALLAPTPHAPVERHS